MCDKITGTNGQAYPLQNNIGRRWIATWKVDYLISNWLGSAAHIDGDLINPRGINIYKNQLWIANSTSLTNYDLFGNKLSKPQSIIDTVNISSSTCLAMTREGFFITVSEDGTINTYYPNVDPQYSHPVLSKQLSKTSIYKGLAIVNNTLYLADFFNRCIDVYDDAYNKLVGYEFIDKDDSDPISLDYAPTNIVCLDGYLFVLWCKKDSYHPIKILDGQGHGFISMFNPDGSFVRRFASRGALNSPWVIIAAPNECGIPPGSFLIGNNGDGRICIYDCNRRYVGQNVKHSVEKKSKLCLDFF